MLDNSTAIARSFLEDINQDAISAHDLKHFHMSHLKSVDALKYGVEKAGFGSGVKSNAFKIAKVSLNVTKRDHRYLFQCNS